MNAVKFKYLAGVIGIAGVAAVVAGLGLSGCASPPISKDVQAQAKAISYAQVRAYPEETRGQVVIWGGRIINVINHTNASSIYIIGMPVDSDARPISKGSSPGRFIAVAPGFLDPALIPHGRRITVAGPLNGVSVQRLGDMAYSYPVMKVDEIHIWPSRSGEDFPEPNYANHPYYGYYGPGWNWNHSLSGVK